MQNETEQPAGTDTIPSAASCLSPDAKRVGLVSQQSDGSVHWSEFIIEDPGPEPINDKWRSDFTGGVHPAAQNVLGPGVVPDAGVHACDCVWRSDGLRVVGYQGDRADLPGGPYDRIMLAFSSDGKTWTNLSVTPGDDEVHFRACRVAVDGSDNVTILFRGSDDKLYQSVFTSDNSLQSQPDDTGAIVSAAATFAISRCVWIDRGGPDRWKALYADADDHLGQIVYGSGADPTTFDTGFEVSAQTPGPGSISVDDGTVYGLGTTQGDDKVYKSDDGGGDTGWSALTEVDKVMANEISTNIYTRGGDIVQITPSKTSDKRRYCRKGIPWAIPAGRRRYRMGGRPTSPS